ncbi:MAG: hypothetical protein H6Q73_3941 [Firmicutes bacterium]|nr:hypothetical protein [Bacillota bacterium]
MQLFFVSRLKTIIEKSNELQKNFDHIVMLAIDKVVSKKLQAVMIDQAKVTVISSQLDSFGRTLNKAIKVTGSTWTCLLKEYNDIPEKMIQQLKRVVLNPGVLYSLHGEQDVKIFHPYALALRNVCYDGISQCDSLSKFYALWNEKNQVILENHFDMPKNPDYDEWKLFTQEAKIEDKSHLYRALEKIAQDYEPES